MNKNLNPENKFIAFLQQEKFKEALDFLKTLPEKEQIDQLRSAYSAKETNTTIDMSELKMVSVLNRKLKPTHTYADFYQAWLPPTTNKTNDNSILKQYFGMTGPGCVIHAANTKDPLEIMSIGLMSTNKSELEKILQTHADSEQQRHVNIAKVADKIGETKLLDIVDIVLT